jgi:hypothetical protein
MTTAFRTPQFPNLFAVEGPRCPRFQHRRDRISLQCVRRSGHAGNHLMDIMDRDAKPGSRTAPCACGGGIVDLVHREMNAEHVATYRHTAWVLGLGPVAGVAS